MIDVYEQHEEPYGFIKTKDSTGIDHTSYAADTEMMYSKNQYFEGYYYIYCYVDLDNENYDSKSVTFSIKKHTCNMVDYREKANFKSAGAVGKVCTDCGYYHHLNGISKPYTPELSSSKYIYDGKVKTPKVKVPIDARGIWDPVIMIIFQKKTIQLLIKAEEKMLVNIR
ncbi:MAG: hypothetical protein ACI4IQ_02865 [Eubacterium sp.]